MCFDSVFGVVEDGSGFEVVFTHAEGLLHVSLLVVVGNNLSGRVDVSGDVGDIAFQVD